MPSQPVVIKDWTIGCDNGLACQAVALQHSADYTDFLSFVVARAADIDAPLKITAFGPNSKADKFRILIDGRLIISGKVTPGETSASIEGADSIKLARAMARGNEIRLMDGAGVMVGRASLSGAKVAFQRLDKAQGRAGTKSAIILTGRKVMRPPPATLPIIAVKRLKESNVLPDTDTLVALAEHSACAAERVEVTQDTVYSLGSKGDAPLALALVSCGGGAYNPASVAFLGTKGADGKWTFDQVAFDYEAYEKADTGGLKLLLHPSWNPVSQTLSSFAKERGLGDCGNSAQYIWDGAMFRLKGATAMNECRGSFNWIPTWRAQVQFVD